MINFPFLLFFHFQGGPCTTPKYATGWGPVYFGELTYTFSHKYHFVMVQFSRGGGRRLPHTEVYAKPLADYLTSLVQQSTARTILNVVYINHGSTGLQ